MVENTSQSPKIKFKPNLFKILWLFLPLTFMMACSNVPYVCQDGESENGIKECDQRFIAYAQKHQDIQNEVFYLRELASIYVRDKNYAQALQELIQAKTFLEKSRQPNPELLAEVLQDIASAYEDLNNSQKAEQYYSQAIAQAEKLLKNQDVLSSILQRSAEFYDSHQQYIKAEMLLKRAMALDTEPLVMALQYRTMCRIYEHQNKLSEAEVCFRDNVTRMKSASDLPIMRQKVTEAAILILGRSGTSGELRPFGRRSPSGL